MQKQKLSVESFQYETMTFIIKIVLGKLLKNMYLHKNPGPFIYVHFKYTYSTYCNDMHNYTA